MRRCFAECLTFLQHGFDLVFSHRVNMIRKRKPALTTHFCVNPSGLVANGLINHAAQRDRHGRLIIVRQIEPFMVFIPA